MKNDQTPWKTIDNHVQKRLRQYHLLKQNKCMISDNIMV